MFLALKEAYALEHDDPEMVSETRKAEKIFLRDRLGRFLPAFAGHAYASFLTPDIPPLILSGLLMLSILLAAISGTPTTTRGTRLADNIVFDRRATSEYTYRSGVVDLMRQFTLTLREAAEVSEHLPVWAEFSVYEGGQAGQVAAKP